MRVCVLYTHTHVTLLGTYRTMGQMRHSTLGPLTFSVFHHSWADNIAAYRQYIIIANELFPPTETVFWTTITAIKQECLLAVNVCTSAAILVHYARTNIWRHTILSSGWEGRVRPCSYHAVLHELISARKLYRLTPYQHQHVQSILAVIMWYVYIIIHGMWDVIVSSLNTQLQSKD